MSNTSLAIKIYDKDAHGVSKAVLHGPHGDRLLCSGSSITQVRQRLPAEKAKFKLRGVTPETLLGTPYTGDAASANTPILLATAKAEEPVFSVAERFEMTGDILDLLLTGDLNAAVLVGRGGTGKSHIVYERLARAGYSQIDVSTAKPQADEDGEVDLEIEGDEDDTYLLVKGAISPTELFKLLHDNRHRKIVFDDCDTAMGTETCVNILKAILDTYDTRRVTWSTPFLEKQGYPASFVFEGKVVFISNKRMDQIPQPIASRSLLLNLDMTNAEICDRAEDLGADLMTKLTATQRDELVAYLRSVADKLKDFSFRTFILAQPMMAKPNWKNLVRFGL